MKSSKFNPLSNLIKMREFDTMNAKKEGYDKESIARNNTLKIIGASTTSEYEREANDYYATDPIASEWLLKLEQFSETVLEPCCGEGHISRVFEAHGHKVISTDLVDRGYGKCGIDLFTYRNIDVDVVTNPPFKYSNEMVSHLLREMQEGRKLCIFQKITFLETQSRRRIFDMYPIHTVYVSSSRIDCAKNGRFDLQTASTMAYAWFIWIKGFKGVTSLKFFN
jgi:hypothetical protein